MTVTVETIPSSLFQIVYNTDNQQNRIDRRWWMYTFGYTFLFDFTSHLAETLENVISFHK